jgi:hypothetical protein
VQTQHIFGRLSPGIDHDFMENGAHHPFFERLRGRRVMPYRAEILAQAQQTLTLSLTEGLVIALQRRQQGFDLLDAL